MTTTIPSQARVPRRRRPGGRRRWSPGDKAAHLAAFARSGRTIREFCAESGVPRSSFVLWQREARATRPLREVPPIGKVPAMGKVAAFARVELVPPGAPGAVMLVVRVRGGLEAELTGLDLVTAVAVMRVVLRAGAR